MEAYLNCISPVLGGAGSWLHVLWMHQRNGFFGRYPNYKLLPGSKIRRMMEYVFHWLSKRNDHNTI